MAPNQDIGSVQRSQEFYRLKEEILSQGAIFELNESAKAMYIGPDSDIGEVQVTYYNPDEPDQLETAVVSVNGPLVGRVDSLPISKVGSTGQPARILISPVDIVKPDYDPSGGFSLDAAPQRTFRTPVLIDFMVALKGLPSIPEVRADRTIRLPQVPFQISTTTDDSDGSTNLLIPIYGRRLVTITAVLHTVTTQARGVNLAVALVTLTPGAANPTPRWVSGDDRTASSVFVPSYDPPFGQQPQTRAIVVRASDAARAGTTMDETGETTGFYVESDQPPPQQFLGQFLPGPRGMADLLLINIKENPLDVPAAEQIGYIDMFIKLADRET